MRTTMNVPVITIDGPSGTGKGTVCALLAAQLGWHQLDSGLIYRALALAVQKAKLKLDEIDDIVRLANSLNLKFYPNGGVQLDAEEVTAIMRTESCGQFASQISAIKAVRKALLQRQRAFLQPPGLVTDGRDMGTVVFPEATLKFFLTASLQERARRRFEQLKEHKMCVTLAQVFSEIAARDERDQTRSFSPLRPADDAIVIDTTALSVREVFELMLRMLSQHPEWLGEGGQLPSGIN